MTKYIEELNSGDCFSINDTFYVLTGDFKRNGNRLAISLSDGVCRWFESSNMVENNQLYVMDKDNNIIPIKPTDKKDANLEI